MLGPSLLRVERVRQSMAKSALNSNRNTSPISGFRGAVVALTALMVGACTTVPYDPAPQPPQTGPVVQVPQQPMQPSQPTPNEPQQPDQPQDVVEAPIDVPDEAAPFFNNRDGITMPHMAGRDTKRLALLLPFSAQSSRLREEANSMFQAAELALFDRPDADVVLTVLDTKGTPEGARSATHAALQQGADVILGPIIADNVVAASEVAARSGTPLLAFSNDQSVAARGRYLLSFPPEAEVERIVQYAMSEGVTRFAYFGPDDAYGRRVRSAYERIIQAMGGEVTAAETYRGNDISVMQEPAQRLAEFYRQNLRQPFDAYEAILLPEAGTALRSLAPLLPFYGVDPDRVLFMGTSRWDDETIAREPALSGGVFAAADKDARASFVASYDRAYGAAPSGLASLAYDAVLLGSVVADGNPRGRIERTESPLGFYGTDGYLRFGPDGRPERGLAIYQIDQGRFITVEPAPRGPAPES